MRMQPMCTEPSNWMIWTENHMMIVKILEGCAASKAKKVKKEAQKIDQASVLLVPVLERKDWWQQLYRPLVGVRTYASWGENHGRKCAYHAQYDSEQNSQTGGIGGGRRRRRRRRASKNRLQYSCSSCPPALSLSLPLLIIWFPSVCCLVMA